MKALKVTTDGEIELIELAGDKLASYYEHIECRCVTSIVPLDDSILATRFPGVNITGWGDDEGLYVEDAQPNITTMVLFGYPPYHALVGIWVIAGHDDEGNTTELPDEVLALAGSSIIDLIDFAPGRGPTAG